MSYFFRRTIFIVIGLGFLIGIVVFWWSGAPVRDLNEAERLADGGETADALKRLSRPERSATRSIRDRASLLRARIAVEEGRLSEAAAAIDLTARLGAEFLGHSGGISSWAVAKPTARTSWVMVWRSTFRNCRHPPLWCHHSRCHPRGLARR